MSHASLVTSLVELNPQPFKLNIFDRIVFTGEFDDRSQLETMSSRKGMIVRTGVSSQTCILVIGNQPSGAWKHGAFGLKIEKAISLINKGSRLKIVRESDYISALEDLPLANSTQIEECKRLSVSRPDFEVRTGTSIALTGTFRTMPRQQLEAALYDKYQFVCTKKISGATQFLVIGDSKQVQGAKLRDALNNGVDCLSESEFLQHYPV